MAPKPIAPFFGALNKSKLKSSVDTFKNTFAKSPDILSFGQLQITTRISDEIEKVVESDLKICKSVLENNKPVLEHVIKALDIAWEITKNKQLDDTLINEIKTYHLTRHCPNIEMIFPGPDFYLPDDIHNNLYNIFWNNLDIKPFPPLNIMSKKGAAKRHHIAHKFEKNKCKDTVRNVARKYYANRKEIFKNIKIDSIPEAGAIGGARLEPVKKDKDTPKKDEDRDDRIKYFKKNQLKQIVESIKKAIAFGHLVICGVLSGIRDDSIKHFPNPEHYILLFGHENIDDKDTFVFWDPDTPTTDISITGWGNGFGVLFFDGNIFSTAYDEADMNNTYKKNEIIFDRLVYGGDHHIMPKRHRYQVYLVEIVPKLGVKNSWPGF